MAHEPRRQPGGRLRLLAAAVAGLALAAPGCSSNDEPPSAPASVPYFQRLTNSSVAESSPSFSPDGGRVTYERGGEIWVLDVTTRDARRVAARGNHPSWSADGASLVFVRRDLEGGGPLHRLVRLHLASGIVDTVSADTIDAYEPAAAPVGDQIALRVLSRVDTRQTLRVLAGDGSEQTTLTSAGTWVDTEPTWSADGRWIAFVRLEDGGATRLFRVLAEGDPDPTPVTSAAAGSGGLSGPSWFPDGRLIFSRGGNVATVAGTGGAPRDFLGGEEFALSPIVSPDGTRLVFTSNRSGNFELWQLVDRAGIGAGPYSF